MQYFVARQHISMLMLSKFILLTVMYALTTIKGNSLLPWQQWVCEYTTLCYTYTAPLTNLQIDNNHRLLTLDAKDLYINIPIRETIHLPKPNF
jgi:hypothetical protein